MANYPTAQMATMLGVSIKTAHARAVREVWVATKREAQGGGYLWEDYSFPKTTLQQVNAYLAIERGVTLAGKQSSQPAHKKIVAQALRLCLHEL